MARLFVHVEGQTEETFVNKVLAPHLYARGFHCISARLIGSPRRRGGICGWSEAPRRDVFNEVDTPRFIPYVSMHEFEALLFSDCESLCREISRPDLLAAFRMITEQFGNPEEINDSPESAPSKRILALLPTYSKRISGTLAALDIGLAKMRSECPHFGSWVRRLEALR